jgi:hypothetical protein
VLKPFPVARRWALCVTDEFFLQGDIERDLGLDPVTPACDRRTQSRVAMQVSVLVPQLSTPNPLNPVS